MAHLVLALVGLPDSTAARAVVAQGVAREEVARVAAATLPAPVSAVPALVPFDAYAKEALEGAFAHAQRQDVLDHASTDQSWLPALGLGHVSPPVPCRRRPSSRRSWTR